MFSDPQSITVNGVTKSMPRVSTGSNESVYATADEAFKMRISHQKVNNRRRHLIRVDQTAVAADPLTAENSYQELGAYIVIDEPFVGFDDTTVGYLVTALTAWLTAGNVAKGLVPRLKVPSFN